MRGCANGGCDRPEPRWAIAEISLRFTRTSGGYRMTVPKKWPAIEPRLQPMTPLDHEHDGKCYGTPPPFSPATLASW